MSRFRDGGISFAGALFTGPVFFGDSGIIREREQRIPSSNEGGRFINDPDTSRQSAQTTEELTVWYPDVTFHGQSSDSFIDTNRVQIAAGAVIDLGNGVRIIGDTKIGPHSVISGGTISSSIVHGEVSGGEVDHSFVLDGGTVSGGTVEYSIVRGRVSGGRVVNYSIIRDGGVVTSGGDVNDCSVENRAIVSTGNHNHETIQGLQPANRLATRITESIMRVGNQRWAHLRRLCPEIRGRNSIRRFMSRSQAERASMGTRSTSPSPKKVSQEEEEFDCDPPGHLVDNIITFSIMNEPYSTPNGESYDLKTIVEHIKKDPRCPVTRKPLEIADLIPNRKLKEAIESWKNEHRIRRS